MSDLIYRNGFGFFVGAGLGFGVSNSFRMLEESDKLPEDIDYRRSYPLGFSAFAATMNDYAQIMSGEGVFEALSDDPAFMAGAALGVYIGERYFEKLAGSELESLYADEELDEVWAEFEKYG